MSMVPSVMFEDLDLRLYAIVDPEHTGGRALPELARLVAAGGATLVQLRDKKTNDPRAMVALARAVKAALPSHVPLIINDNVDVAIEAGADGVHLGQDDISVLKARERLGPMPFIGLTVQTIEHARAAPLADIDYVGIGGVFATSSKVNPRPPIGTTGLHAIVEVFRYRIGNVPMCAIAGITSQNAGEAIAAGADGIAVISALSLAPDPTTAAREMRAAVDTALARRAPVVPDTRERHHGDTLGHGS
jgi:thiamine-phosphate pyrophosphorylase